MNKSVSIRGFVVGPIWWPVGEECFKLFSYDVSREAGRYTEPADLTMRDHLLAITNDVDFQGCTVACGEIVIERRKGRKTIKDRVPLDRWAKHFDIADMLHPDPDWCPPYDDDE